MLVSTSSGTNSPQQNRLDDVQTIKPRNRLRILKIGKNTYPYTELQGIGAPSIDLGEVGDIYLDLTPGSLALYGRYMHVWKIWPGPNCELLHHPNYPSRCLWCNESVGWYEPMYLKGYLPAGQTQSEILLHALNKKLLPKKRKGAVAIEQSSTTFKWSRDPRTVLSTKARTGIETQLVQQSNASSVALTSPHVTPTAMNSTTVDFLQRLIRKLFF
ncbi:hypothetical protein CPB84DRAFT_564643 [Gymnopilus junonius]|uniref:Uncharacterized protein n=1 Tax=Gymnopilus junonius TaxID=109634 RepID=A0A9P5NUG8_GYMJU|nr:hypothetical protein CPB84DRAFT_564643 [Gymnopilus junonius]